MQRTEEIDNLIITLLYELPATEALQFIRNLPDGIMRKMIACMTKEEREDYINLRPFLHRMPTKERYEEAIKNKKGNSNE